MKTDAYDEQIFNPGDLQEDEIGAFMNRVKSDAMRFRGIGIEQSDRIIALSTCSEADTNGRSVLLGRLSELGKDESEVEDKQ